MEEMHYVPNEAGKMLKQKENNTVIFVFSEYNRNFYMDTLRGINTCLQEKGYDFIICQSRSCEKYMRSSMSRGAIILDQYVKDEMILRAASEDYPVVLMDRVLESPYARTVMTDNEAAMREMTQSAVDKGYRRFAFLGGREFTMDAMERYQGFRDVLEKNNIPFLHKNYFSGDWGEKSGYMTGKIISLADSHPDVLICACDDMAIGAMRAFRENGIRVPEDIAVTGFDDTIRAGDAGLTTVTVPEYERGYLAAMYLVESIKYHETQRIMRIAAKVKYRDTLPEKLKKGKK